MMLRQSCLTAGAIKIGAGGGGSLVPPLTANISLERRAACAVYGGIVLDKVLMFSCLIKLI